MRTREEVIALLTPLALLVPLLAPGDALAQGASMEYTQTTVAEAPGIVGALLARAASGERNLGMHVLGSRMRTDNGSSSTIFDAAAREWTFLDHDARTFMTISFAEMQQMTAEMMKAAREGRTEAEAELEELRAEREAARAEMEEAQQTMEVSIEHIVTGETSRIQGYDADRHQIIVTLEEAEGIEGAEEVEGGSLVILLDIWLSEELARQSPLYSDGTPGQNPFYDALMEDPAYREFAEEMAASFESGEAGSNLEAYAMVDPQVGAAMAEAFESLAEMDGMPVRTTTVVAVLAPAVELDTEMLIAWEPASMGDQMRGQASEAAQSAARDAARGAVRNLTRGVFGRGGGDPPEPEVAEDDLVIRPLFRVTSETSDVQVGGPPSPDLFVIPEGYRQIEMPTMADPAAGPAAGPAAP